MALKLFKEIISSVISEISSFLNFYSDTYGGQIISDEGLKVTYDDEEWEPIQEKLNRYKKMDKSGQEEGDETEASKKYILL